MPNLYFPLAGGKSFAWGEAMIRASFCINPNPAFDHMELLIAKGGQMTENQTKPLIMFNTTDFLADSQQI